MLCASGSIAASAPRLRPLAASAAALRALQPMDATRAHFLDRPAERATTAVLRGVGVSVAPVAESAPAGDARTLALDPALLREHRAASGGGRTTYCLADGSPAVFLDVRDSADAWVRLRLSAGVQVHVDGAAWRRLSPDPLDPLAAARGAPMLCERPGERDERPQPPQPRFAREEDARALREAPELARARLREAACQLCREGFAAGWMTGTGGAVSVRVGERFLVTPSGVPKELVSPDDLFVLDRDGAVLSAPAARPDSDRPPKLSDCAPLFTHVHAARAAGAVIHSHGLECNLVAALCEGRDAFRCSHQEMIKGLAGLGFADELVVPIVDNEPTEAQLAAPVRAALEAAPAAVSAVLVRRHGLFVWGRSWAAAKRHAECLHYLFQAAIELHRLGLDLSAPPAGPPSLAERHRVVLLDIEGTTTPISFVHDVLFPFATAHAARFLRQTWASPATRADVAALRAQHAADVAAGASPEPAALPPAAADGESSEREVEALAAFVRWNVALDRKVGALKQLQGRVWRQGYESGELKAQVYADVPPLLRRLRARGVRVAIYSSGSRQAQKLLFQHSDRGDLREFLAVYFDTAVGHKRERESYEQILQSLGVDSGRDVLFVTDVLEEAQAAAQAGLDAVLSVRPGTKPLPAAPGFPTVSSFDEL